MSGLVLLHTLLKKELKDIYDAEKQMTKALPRMATNASAAELKSAFENHIRQTQDHVERKSNRAGVRADRNAGAREEKRFRF